MADQGGRWQRKERTPVLLGEVAMARACEYCVHYVFFFLYFSFHISLSLWKWDVYACEEIRRRHLSRQAMKRQDSHLKRLVWNEPRLKRCSRFSRNLQHEMKLCRLRSFGVHCAKVYKYVVMFNPSNTKSEVTVCTNYEPVPSYRLSRLSFFILKWKVARVKMSPPIPTTNRTL
jgi:hypothetical protein